MVKKKLKPKGLIVSQYFYPENFRINEIAKYLNNKNYKIDILTGYPCYPNKKIYEKFYKNKKNFSKYYNCKIYRLPTISRGSGGAINLLLNYFSFLITGIMFSKKLLKKNNYDFIFTFGVTPLTVALVSNYISKLKNAKSILWLLDLWPQVINELKVSKIPFFFFLAKIISKKVFTETDYILVQSKSFKKEISYYKTKNKIVYFPNWAEEFKKKKIAKTKEKKIFSIVFAGNIGEAQNFDKVLEAANILKNENLRWIIVGSGRFLEKVKKYIFDNRINNFHIIGHKNKKNIWYYYNLADILLLSLKGTKYISKTIPGKLQTYLRTNKYIIGFSKGESAKLIMKSKAGSIINPDRPDLLAKRIKYLLENKDIILKRENSIDTKKYIQKLFNRKIILNFLDKKIIRTIIK